MIHRTAEENERLKSLVVKGASPLKAAATLERSLSRSDRPSLPAHLPREEYGQKDRRIIWAAVGALAFLTTAQAATNLQKDIVACDAGPARDHSEAAVQPNLVGPYGTREGWWTGLRVLKAGWG